MGLTPQSMPSPTSSLDSYSSYKPEICQTYEYPSPARSDENNKQPLIFYGLGLFDCPMSLSDAGRHVSMSPPPLSSSHAVSNWSTSALQSYATISQALPSGSGFSLEHDSYPHYNNAGNHGHDHYHSMNSTLPASPVPSHEDSQRSSYSSLASTPYYSGSMQHGFDPRVKAESTWSQDYVESTLLPPISLSNSSPPMDTAMSCSRAFDPNYYYQQPNLNWREFDHCNNMSSMTPPPPQTARLHGHDSVPSRDRRSNSAGVTRARQPRKLTTKEDANFQCMVKGCGKLFGRSYNYKAHMETHDVDRVYPFPCPVQDCTKKFVRKTDLQRHHQSVHMRERNFKCDYCSRHFARKDTLRRHMEDGCPKRFEISAVDLSNQSVYSANSSESKDSPHQQNVLPRYSPSIMHPYQPINQTMTGTPYPSHSAGSSPCPAGSSPYAPHEDPRGFGIQQVLTWSS